MVATHHHTNGATSPPPKPDPKVLKSQLCTTVHYVVIYLQLCFRVVKCLYLLIAFLYIFVLGEYRSCDVSSSNYRQFSFHAGVTAVAFLLYVVLCLGLVFIPYRVQNTLRENGLHLAACLLSLIFALAVLGITVDYQTTFTCGEASGRVVPVAIAAALAILAALLVGLDTFFKHKYCPPTGSQAVERRKLIYRIERLENEVQVLRDAAAINEKLAPDSDGETKLHHGNGVNGHVDADVSVRELQ